jgi:hypothetical protein
MAGLFGLTLLGACEDLASGPATPPAIEASESTAGVEESSQSLIAPGVTSLVSVADGTNAQFTSNSDYSSLNDDGNSVTFWFTYNNVVLEPLLRDRAGNRTLRLAGSQPVNSSTRPSGQSAIDGAGRRSVFTSTNSLTSDDVNGVSDVYVYDRTTGTYTRASVKSDGSSFPAGADPGVISRNGNVVAFLARPSAYGGNQQIYVRDLSTRTTEQITVKRNEGARLPLGSDPPSEDTSTDADSDSGFNYSGAYESSQYTNLAVSADGSVVVFASRATNLVWYDKNGFADVFVRDRSAHTTTRISVAKDGTEGNGASSNCTISADGRYIAFESQASNLVPGDNNHVADIFLYDRNTKAISRISLASDGTEGNDYSTTPSLDAAGGRVVYVSRAWNLVSGDTNNVADVFATDLATGTTTRLSVSSSGTEATAPSFQPAISGDGQTVSFTSWASNLVASDTNNKADIFVHTIRPVSGIGGQVTTVAGTPIPGVRLDLAGKTIYTDARGYYKITLPAGTGTLVVPSKSGWTFGSLPFMLTKLYTTAGPNTRLDITGYDREPIVWVPGFGGKMESYDDVPDALKSAGYMRQDAPSISGMVATPSMVTNAAIVKSSIELAKYKTGRPTVILIARSHGGLVSRTYMEEPGVYQFDVSRFFDMGTPHLGLSDFMDVGLLATLEPLGITQYTGIKEMTSPYTAVFNALHPFRAPGVEYHLIGGNAPMWKVITVGFKIFNRKIRFSFPLPDFTYRSKFGWAFGAAIPGPDDGFIETGSSLGLPGMFDRYLTDETHQDAWGKRRYTYWDGKLSEQAYDKCLKKLLVVGGTRTCGSTVLVPDLVGPAIGAPPVLPLPSPILPIPDPVGAAQLLASGILNSGVIHAGETITRTILVEGGATAIEALWPKGTVTVELKNPAGQVITAKSIAEQALDPNDATEEATAPLPDMVTYHAGAGSASFFLPAALPGLWTVTLKGEVDLPPEGVLFNMQGNFDSPLTVKAEYPSMWLTPGSTATFNIVFSQPVWNTQFTASIKRADGKVDVLGVTATSSTTFQARYVVPAVPGPVQLAINAAGAYGSGKPFERSIRRSLQINSTNFALSGSYSEVPEPSLYRPGKYQALVTRVGINANTRGTVGVSANLVDASGKVVAHAYQRFTVAAGASTVGLRFIGQDIYRSGVNGPYRLTDLIVTDETTDLLVCATASNVLTTAAYDYRLFGELMFGGHAYEVVTTRRNWTDASNDCTSRKGHLVSIGTSVENDFVRSLIPSTDNRVWIGFTDTSGRWAWTSGETPTFFNWSGGEPNNWGGVEHWAEMQKSGSWNDLPMSYTAAYVCEWEPSVARWTPWLDRDDPSGNGENEEVAAFLPTGQVCPSPLAIQCRRVSDKLDWSQTGEKVICQPALGLTCLNAEQSDGICDDYEVRFACPDPAAQSAWFNQDIPDDGVDIEPLSTLVSVGLVCAEPIGIECQSAGGINWTKTGDQMNCSPNRGALCLARNQPDGRCEDYSVRYTCLGNGSWTPWLNRDSPSGNGDGEHLSIFVQEGKVCANPVGIQCRRASDMMDWTETGERVVCNTRQGATCLNSEQSDGQCDDYEVRFFCAPIAE